MNKEEENGMELLMKALDYDKENKIDKAMECYDKAVKICPQDSLFYAMRSSCWARQGNLANAILDSEKSAELAGGDEESIRHTALLKAQHAGEKEEVEKIKKVMEYLKLGLGDFHSACDRESFNRAKEYFSKILELEPSSGEALFHRGLVYLELGESDLAIDDLSNAVKINPEDKEGYCNLAGIFLDKGDLQKALEYAENGLKCGGDDFLDDLNEIIKEVKEQMAKNEK